MDQSLLDDDIEDYLLTNKDVLDQINYKRDSQEKTRKQEKYRRSTSLDSHRDRSRSCSHHSHTQAHSHGRVRKNPTGCDRGRGCGDRDHGYSRSRSRVSGNEAISVQSPSNTTVYTQALKKRKTPIWRLTPNNASCHAVSPSSEDGYLSGESLGVKRLKNLALSDDDNPSDSYFNSPSDQDRFDDYFDLSDDEDDPPSH